MARFSTVTPTTGFTYGPFLGHGGRGVGRHPGARSARDVVRDWMPHPPRAPRPPNFSGLGQSAAPRSTGTFSASKPKPKRRKRNTSPAVKCKRVEMKNGKKRRMCWDKHGKLTSKNKPASKGRGRSKKKGSR